MNGRVVADAGLYVSGAAPSPAHDVKRGFGWRKAPPEWRKICRRRGSSPGTVEELEGGGGGVSRSGSSSRPARDSIGVDAAIQFARVP